MLPFARILFGEIFCGFGLCLKSDELEGHGWHSGGRSQLEVLRLLLVVVEHIVALLSEARQVQQPRGPRGSLRCFTGALVLSMPSMGLGSSDWADV